VIGFGFVLFIALPLVLWIGAMILRAAISFANKRIGPAPEPSYLVEDDDDWGDYPLPSERERSSGAIPVPGIGRGMWMILAVVIVNVIVGAAIQVVMGEGPGPGRRGGGLLDDADFLARLITVPVSFLVTAGLLAVMLPTRFGRGCLVALFYYLICIGIAIGCAVPMFALRLVFRGG
jgi:hypothetical protein